MGRLASHNTKSHLKLYIRILQDSSVLTYLYTLRSLTLKCEPIIQAGHWYKMPSKMIILSIALVMSIVGVTFACANQQKLNVVDCGTHGHVFEIKEVSLLDEILEKLSQAEKDGKLEDLNKQFAEKVRLKVLRPNPVTNISKAKTDRSWTYNPAFTQDADIKDDKGNIIVKNGTRVNPLEQFSWGEPLIFIDGDDSEQIEWAKTQVGKIVLVKGAPLELGKELGQPIYFDQGGIFCRQFKIEAVPAIIEQQDKVLVVREVAL